MTAPSVPSDHLLAGRYRLTSSLGTGGMGTVWRATDELLQQEVAVKEVRLPPDLDEAAAAELFQRTLREARAAARLRAHPSIVTVHDVVVDGDRPWIVMELLHGHSLDQTVREHGPLPPGRVAAIGLRLLDALTAAHGLGITHRDVKPANILLTDDGRVVLTDFGIAVLAGESTLTQTGLVSGSPGFMAPERLQGADDRPESDLWSLGATLYAAVEGRSPYARERQTAVLAAVLLYEPHPMRNAGPLAPVITGLLEKDPDRRLPADRAAALLRPIAAGAGRPAAGSPAAVPPDLAHPSGPHPSPYASGPHTPPPGRSYPSGSSTPPHDLGPRTPPHGGPAASAPRAPSHGGAHASDPRIPSHGGPRPPAGPGVAAGWPGPHLAGPHPGVRPSGGPAGAPGSARFPGSGRPGPSAVPPTRRGRRAPGGFLSPLLTGLAISVCVAIVVGGAALVWVLSEPDTVLPETGAARTGRATPEAGRENPAKARDDQIRYTKEPEACRLLSVQQATKILGGKAKQRFLTKSACMWQREDTGSFINVTATRMPTADQAHQMYLGMLKTMAEEPRRNPGTKVRKGPKLGEESFSYIRREVIVDTPLYRSQILIRQGNVTLTVYLTLRTSGYGRPDLTASMAAQALAAYR
ncbi:serine/threonine-protein kinase [Sphaerisporangium rufum]|uniref:serine/threonine-protein kinase n=1 Tax=Sphaerisporangium rufum TaxID=1381558 RepID=UPI0023B2B08B|nr:serine/threonine-protein kinase [Sphaerisporangium rufum]